ncbi:MAG: cytochrome P460 family protein [Aggregatilineales bacterium]
MTRKFIYVYMAILVLVLSVSAVISATQPIYKTPLDNPVSNGISLPLDYRENFIKYATVDRVDNLTRDIFIDPAVLPLIEAGVELPLGTKIVIEAFNASGSTPDGHFTQGHQEPFIHVAEKRDGWSLEDLPVSSHVGDWNFASFTADSLRPSNENLNDCFTCHDDSASTRLDFTFSRAMIDTYLRTEETQFDYCNRPDRLRCS